MQGLKYRGNDISERNHNQQTRVVTRPVLQGLQYYDAKQVSTTNGGSMFQHDHHNGWRPPIFSIYILFNYTRRALDSFVQPCIECQAQVKEIMCSTGKNDTENYP